MEKEITVIEARDLIRENKDNDSLQLIDVRSKEAFANGSIPNFINIPLIEVSRNIPELDGKKKTLVLCNNGKQSFEAIKLLESCGFEATVIRGGINDWRKIIDSSLSL